MTALSEDLKVAKEQIAQQVAAGTWKPQPGDPIFECEFVKTGFRAWGLEAPDKTWRLSLTRLDFGSKDPSALLEVFAPNHANAFGDLNWFAFSNSIGVNGGTNYNQCVKRLHRLLGGAETDWELRITYLIARARQANAGANNGTFSMTGVPIADAPPPYVFDQRMREGRTISIFGPGSAGKTTLVDGLIAAACSGHEVIPGWRPTRQYRVLVLDWDEGYEEEMVRLAAICRAHEIELSAEYHYKRMARPLHDIADEIGAYIVANRIEIVVVSPMGRAQRNFGENITAPVDEVHEIIRSFGTTNILIDHVTGDNIKGKAEREFGSVRKRDNVRGSYAVDVQFEEPGRRTLVMRNTKADALAPRQPEQAIRVEYEPRWPDENGRYNTISFHPDEVSISAPGDVVERIAMRVAIRDMLSDGLHLTYEDIATRLNANPGSVKACLHRNRDWFNQLASGKWEVLPIGSSATGSAT